MNSHDSEDEEEDMSADVDCSHDDWVDEDDCTPDCLCLFCTDRFPSAVATFLHCRETHKFDIVHAREGYQLDCFSYIRLINYIRSSHCTADSLYTGSGATPSVANLWEDDRFMRPVIEDDALLISFDIEDLSPELLTGPSSALTARSNDTPARSVTLTAAEYNELLLRLRVTETKLQHSQDALERAMENVEALRSVVRDNMLSDDSAMTAVLPSGDEVISTLRAEDDQLYIESYSHFSIHEEMLKDSIRTHSYRDCVYNNEALFKDRVVLDVGCGLGILSMFAAKAGAKLVIGVDQSEIIFQAMDVVRENGLEKQITLIHGKMEEVQLPVEKVDIIISEWMGYFLLYESMLDTVLWARNQYLKADDGLVLPDHCSMKIVGVHDDKMHESRVGFWDDVSGFKMTSMKSIITAEADTRVVSEDTIITEEVELKTINTLTCLYKDLDFTSDFTLHVNRTGRITAIIGYFDVEFQCPSKVFFSTGPRSTPTHWKQTVFLLEKPVTVTEGENIVGAMKVKKNPKDPRCLVITLTLAGRTSTFQMQ